MLRGWEEVAGFFGQRYEAGQLYLGFDFLFYRMMEDPSTGGGVRVPKPKCRHLTRNY